jgi:hypothetical protein
MAMTRNPDKPGRSHGASRDSRMKPIAPSRGPIKAGIKGRVGRKSSVPATPPEGLRRRFRIGEVAAAFGCAPRTIRSWIEKGLLEREKVGNAVFIREDQIEAMLLGSARKKNRSNIKHKNRHSKNTTW